MQYKHLKNNMHVNIQAVMKSWLISETKIFSESCPCICVISSLAACLVVKKMVFDI